MIKRIKIDGKDVGFKASASLPLRYRDATGRDYFVDMQNLGDAVELEEDESENANEDKAPAGRLSQAFDSLILYAVMHVMARAYDSKVPQEMIEWLDGFEEFPFFVLFNELMPLINESMATTKK